MSNERMRCECGWEGMSDDLRVICVFHATQEEPAEYENLCPSCDRPYDELETVPLCHACQDVYVPEEGDRCGACLEAEEAGDPIFHMPKMSATEAHAMVAPKGWDGEEDW